MFRCPAIILLHIAKRDLTDDSQCVFTRFLRHVRRLGSFPSDVSDVMTGTWKSLSIGNGGMQLKRLVKWFKGTGSDHLGAAMVLNCDIISRDFYIDE